MHYSELKQDNSQFKHFDNSRSKNQVYLNAQKLPASPWYKKDDRRERALISANIRLISIVVGNFMIETILPVIPQSCLLQTYLSDDKSFQFILEYFGDNLNEVNKNFSRADI